MMNEDYRSADMLDAYADLLEAQPAIERWKQAVIDAAVVHWTLQKEHEDDPRAAIDALLRMAQKEALDPLISGSARAIERAAVERLVKKARAVVVGFYTPNVQDFVSRVEELRAELPPDKE